MSDGDNLVSYRAPRASALRIAAPDTRTVVIRRKGSNPPAGRSKNDSQTLIQGNQTVGCKFQLDRDVRILIHNQWHPHADSEHLDPTKRSL